MTSPVLMNRVLIFGPQKKQERGIKKKRCRKFSRELKRTARVPTWLRDWLLFSLSSLPSSTRMITADIYSRDWGEASAMIMFVRLSHLSWTSDLFHLFFLTYLSVECFFSSFLILRNVLSQGSMESQEEWKQLLLNCNFNSYNYI